MDKIYLEWINYGIKDLESAKYLQGMYPPPLEIICYHCQQSAEKMLKAYLIKSGKEPKKTHDLEELYKEILKTDKNIEQIFDQCLNLTDFAVNTRYPYQLDLTLEDVIIAIEDAEKIKKCILDLI